MKKIVILLMAAAVTSCTGSYVEDYEEQVTDAPVVAVEMSEEYAVMYDFMETLYLSDLFGIAEPSYGMSYDDMMMVAASVVMTDVFGDTIAEGDCEQVYRLMYAYFSENYPSAEITAYLQFILDNGMY